MSGQNIWGPQSAPAGADLSAKQFYFVKKNGSGQIILCDTAGEHPLGVLDNAPVSGADARYIPNRGAKLQVVYGGAVTKGDKVSTDANGKCVKSVTSTHAYIGVANVTGVSGDVGDIDFTGYLGAVP